jgi:hypothetical protein
MRERHFESSVFALMLLLGMNELSHCSFIVIQMIKFYIVCMLIDLLAKSMQIIMIEKVKFWEYSCQKPLSNEIMIIAHIFFLSQ